MALKIHVCTMWESYPIIFFGGLASTTVLTSSSVGLMADVGLKLKKKTYPVCQKRFVDALAKIHCSRECLNQASYARHAD